METTSIQKYKIQIFATIEGHADNSPRVTAYYTTVMLFHIRLFQTGEQRRTVFLAERRTFQNVRERDWNTFTTVRMEHIKSPWSSR